MSRLLKGNYKLPEKPQKPKAEAPNASDTSTQTFERRALEHLGGSIAYVMKRNTFVWKGDAKPASQEPPAGS